MKKYDIFISYRRDGGAETAKHLRDTLVEKGYKVFLDIESLRSGPFNTELYRVIENSKDVLVILPENALDRCVNKDDWVRLEIEHAKRCEKNIIPIMLTGFSFPDELPESIEFLRIQNGIAANIEYYDAFIKNVEKFLVSRHFIPKSMRWMLAAAALVLVGAITFGCFKYFSRFPRNAGQRNLVSDVIAYISPNFTLFDKATSDYKSAIDSASEYAKGNPAYSFDTVDMKLEAAIDGLEKKKQQISELPDDLKDRISKSPFDSGAIGTVAPTFNTAINYYVGRLTYFKNSLPLLYDSADLEYSEVQRHTFLNLFENEKETANLWAEYFFYGINEILFPVNVESALADFKDDVLPELTEIYAKHPEFSKNLEEVKSKMEAINNQIKKLAEADQKIINDLAAYVNGANGQANAKTDVTETLDLAWKAMEAGDTAAAAAAFRELSAHYSDDKDLFLAVTNAARLAENSEKLGIKGGALVLYYEESDHLQTLQPGDIIFEINDVRINNTYHLHKAVSDGINPVKIIRFSEDGYEIIDAIYDSNLEEPIFLSINPTL